MVNFHKSWAEVIFFIILLIGFVIAALAQSAVISYMIIFVAGMMGGRLMYFRKDKLKAGYFIIIFGFIIGYVLASLIKPTETYGNVSIIVILFVLGYLFSYYLHDRKVIISTQY